MREHASQSSGAYLFRSLVSSARAWRAAAAAIGECLGGRSRRVSIRAIVACLRQPGLRVIGDALIYRNVRLAGALVVALGYRLADSPDDWRVLRQSGPRRLCDRWGIDYSAAILLREGMRRTYPDYGLLDLSCFLLRIQLLHPSLID